MSNNGIHFSRRRCHTLSRRQTPASFSGQRKTISLLATRSATIKKKKKQPSPAKKAVLRAQVEAEAAVRGEVIGEEILYAPNAPAAAAAAGEATGGASGCDEETPTDPLPRLRSEAKVSLFFALDEGWQRHPASDLEQADTIYASLLARARSGEHEPGCAPNTGQADRYARGLTAPASGLPEGEIRLRCPENDAVIAAWSQARAEKNA